MSPGQDRDRYRETARENCSAPDRRRHLDRPGETPERTKAGAYRIHSSLAFLAGVRPPNLLAPEQPLHDQNVAYASSSGLPACLRRGARCRVRFACSA